jgi:quercetin dioxygenase-like cupin family protein
MLMIRVVSLVALVAVALCNAPAAPAQTQARSKDAHDHWLSQCLDDGPKSSESGYFLLAKKEITRFPEGVLFWHLNKFPSRAAADAARSKTGMVVEADGSFWLFSFGPKDAAPKQGEFVASVGPLQMTSDAPSVAKSYEVVAYLNVMPAGTHTRVHTHSGPEAWYVLEGEQCLETPAGTIKAGAGVGAMVRPMMPMQLKNTGTSTRRALSVVIHDAARPWVAFTNEWKPTGMCDRNRD